MTNRGVSQPMFRPDINGLRALAVTLVLLFHFGIAPFSGGFVGVDVFFVISGFLMTGIVAAAARRGNLSLAGFYVARIKRIVPALLVVVLATMAAGSALLMPQQFEQAADDGMRAALFVINLFFADTSNYFAPKADQSWFLHCWSLAVEAQFYLLIPFWITMSQRLSANRGVLLGLLVIIAASLSASWLQTRSDATSAFYLPTTRAWEFAAGGLVSELRAPRGGRRLIAVFGLALIVVASVGYDTLMAYPGLWPVVPVAGAALVIWAVADLRALSNGATQFLGTISYSVYLWHWPVLMVGKALFPGGGVPLLVGEVALVLSLSTLSYRFVEMPCRRSWHNAKLSPFLSAAAAVACIVAISETILIYDGFPDRIPANIRKIVAAAGYGNNWRGHKCFLDPDQNFSDFGSECFGGDAHGKKQLFLWGDSTIAQFYSGLMAQSWIGKFDVEQATASACNFSGLPLPGGRPFCGEIRKQTLEFILRQKPAYVMLSTAIEYLGPFPKGGFEAYVKTVVEPLKAIVGTLKRGGVEEVVVLGPLPTWKEPLPVVFARNGLRTHSTPAMLEPPFMENIVAWDAAMRAATVEAGGVFVSLIDHLCKGDLCTSLMQGPHGPELPQFDSLHLTSFASTTIAGTIIGPALGEPSVEPQ